MLYSKWAHAMATARDCRARVCHGRLVACVVTCAPSMQAQGTVYAFGGYMMPELTAILTNDVHACVRAAAGVRRHSEVGLELRRAAAVLCCVCVCVCVFVWLCALLACCCCARACVLPPIHVSTLPCVARSVVSAVRSVCRFVRVCVWWRGVRAGRSFLFVCLTRHVTSCGRVRRLNVSSNVWYIVYPSLRAPVGSMGLAVYQ